jgi:methanogenic corrinoid protein MtbC1
MSKGSNRRRDDESVAESGRGFPSFMTANADADHRADLLATLEHEIIPKLAVAHRLVESGPATCDDARPPPTQAEIEEFARIAVTRQLSTALQFIETIVGQGLSIETVLLQLVTPAARLLGEQWEDDTTSFADVTFGLATIQQVVHVLGPDFSAQGVTRGEVVLLSPQAEQHSLGIYIMREFLVRAGWNVRVAPSISATELTELVRSEPIDMVGISVSNLALVDSVRSMVRSVRAASKNPDVLVLLGGAAGAECADGELGATFCSEPREAVRWLESSVRRSRPPRA